MNKSNGTAERMEQTIKENLDQVIPPVKPDDGVLKAGIRGAIGISGTLDRKFTINIQSDGKMSLTIRTEDEDELEQLIERWESRIVVFQEPVAPSGQRNGNGNKAEKTRYYPGDQCPQCSNKLVRRNGSKGKFLGCNNYPECTFVQGL